MTLLVDTSVWSLALRRDGEAAEPEVHQLKDALLGSEVVVTTGLVLQELLQGFTGPKASAQIIERFAALPLLQPDREDHVGAAALRNACRQAGVQVGTIDALLAQLCIRHDLTLITTDRTLRMSQSTALFVYGPRRHEQDGDYFANPSLHPGCEGRVNRTGLGVGGDAAAGPPMHPRLTLIFWTAFAA